MKLVFMLLMAMLVIKTTGAQGQQACSNAYIGCMDKCVSRPSQSLQDNCIEACQSQNNACFSKAYGAPGTGVQSVRQEPARRGDAQARTQPSGEAPADAQAGAQAGVQAGAAAADQAAPDADEPRQAAKPVKSAKPTKTAKPAAKSERRAQ